MPDFLPVGLQDLLHRWQPEMRTAQEISVRSVGCFTGSGREMPLPVSCGKLMIFVWKKV